MQAIGKFGNSKLNYNGDWVKPIEDGLKGILSPDSSNSVWNDET